MTRTRQHIPKELQDWNCEKTSNPEIYRKRLIWRFWQKVDKTPGLGPKGDCWEWRGARSAGYGEIGVVSGHLGIEPNLFGKDGYRILKAHALAYRYVYGHEDVPFGYETHICHSCNNKLCVRDEHLWVGTPLRNAHHAQATGLTPIAKPKQDKSTGWHISAFSDEQRAILRSERRRQGVGFSWLCRVLEIDKSHLSKIETGKDARGLRFDKTLCLLQILGIDREAFRLSECPLTLAYKEPENAKYKEEYQRIQRRLRSTRKVNARHGKPGAPKDLWLRRIQPESVYFDAPSIKQSLLQLDISQADLAARTGLSAQMVARVVRGAGSVPIAALRTVEESIKALSQEKAA